MIPWAPPMLATLIDRPFSRTGWIFEPKLDGERCLSYGEGKTLQLYSRNRIVINDQYPEIVRALRQQSMRSFVLDGEIVAFEPGTTITSFHQMQQRMHVDNPSPELQRRVPVFYYLFDLLYLNGRDLRSMPLSDRKALLQQAVNWAGCLRLSTHRDTDGETYYHQACELHWEGLIAKRSDSPYRAGRSQDWLKFKCLNEQEFVIGGYTDPQGSRVGFGALLLGYYDGPHLKYAGKVGTGYDTTDLQRIQSRLNRLERSRSPFHNIDISPRHIHWVEPHLVAEIAFAEWTKDGKLRQGRFLGLRDDKTPRDVTRETKKPVNAVV
jgi:bifunctional non-homologous end joining protein LigD